MGTPFYPVPVVNILVVMLVFCFSISRSLSDQNNIGPKRRFSSISYQLKGIDILFFVFRSCFLIYGFESDAQMVVLIWT